MDPSSNTHITGKANNKIFGRRKAREFLVQALYQWNIAQTRAEEIRKQFYANTVFSSSKLDFEYFDSVLLHITNLIPKIDSKLKDFIDRPLDKIDAVEISILRLGCYELSYKAEIPYKVIINEWIEISKRYGGAQSHKYINGILDKLATNIRNETFKTNE